MRAHVPPASTDGTIPVTVDIEPGDRLGRIVAEISLPYLRRRLATLRPDRVPFIDACDVPAWLRPKNPVQSDVLPKLDDLIESMDGRQGERWAYILGEMIWAMEAMLDWRGRMGAHIVENADIRRVPIPGQPGSFDVEVIRPSVVDRDGMRTDAERLREGHRLFARYIQAV